MSKFQRSFTSRLRIWINERSRSLLHAKWLRSSAVSIRQGLRQIRRTASGASRRVTRSITNSSLATRANGLVRSVRRLESGTLQAMAVVARGVGQALAGLIPQPIRRLSAWVGRASWQVLSTLLVFLGGWFRSRQYWLLIGGIPAFLLTLPMTYCAIQLPLHSHNARAKHYRSAVSEALVAKDYASATLYYRKLNQLGAINEVVEFQAAVNKFESGDIAGAVAAMKELAPEDEAIFAPAHVWLANWYLNDDDDDEAVRRVELHLQHTLSLDPDNPAARTMRAALYQRVGRWNDALSELEAIVRSRPEQGLSLAGVYARQGRWDAAQREIQRVLQLYTDKAQRNEKLQPIEYLIWSSAFRALGDTQRTVDVLSDGYAVHPDDKKLADRLYQCSLARADIIAANRGGECEEICRRLVTAHAIRPDANDPLLRLGKLTQEPGEMGSQARAAVQSLLESEHPPATLFSIMGSVVGSAGDLQQAHGYLERAVELAPNNASALNNLAYLLLKLGPDHHQRALQLAEKAVELRPTEPVFRETRGQLRLRLGHYQPAIDDLVIALNGLGDRPDVHRSLAEAYQELGLTEQAQQHRAKMP